MVKVWDSGEDFSSLLLCVCPVVLLLNCYFTRHSELYRPYYVECEGSFERSEGSDPGVF